MAVIGWIEPHYTTGGYVVGLRHHEAAEPRILELSYEEFLVLADLLPGQLRQEHAAYLNVRREQERGTQT